MTAKKFGDVGWSSSSCFHGCQCCLSQTQFEHRLEKGEGRLRALIFVRAVGMQAVATTAGRRIVDRQVQIVAAEEPVEGAPRFFVPALDLP